MIGLLEEEGTVGEDKVLRTCYIDMLDGRDGIGILEATVEYGDGHPLALHADVVEALSEQHLYLFFATAVELSFQTVPGVEGFVGFLADHTWDTVWRGPYMLRLPHTGEGGNPL